MKWKSIHADDSIAFVRRHRRDVCSPAHCCISRRRGKQVFGIHSVCADSTTSNLQDRRGEKIVGETVPALAYVSGVARGGGSDCAPPPAPSQLRSRTSLLRAGLDGVRTVYAPVTIDRFVQTADGQKVR